MDEKETGAGRARRLLRRADDAIKTASGTLSGKNVEQQVAEYSEVYTQVLLGLHGDVEVQGRRIEHQNKEIDALKRQIASFNAMQPLAGDLEPQSKRNEDHAEQIDTLKRQIASFGTVRGIGTVAVVIALLALGVALWSAL